MHSLASAGHSIFAGAPFETMWKTQETLAGGLLSAAAGELLRGEASLSQPLTSAVIRTIATAAVRIRLTVGGPRQKGNGLGRLAGGRRRARVRGMPSMSRRGWLVLGFGFIVALSPVLWEPLLAEYGVDGYPWVALVYLWSASPFFALAVLIEGRKMGWPMFFLTAALVTARPSLCRSICFSTPAAARPMLSRSSSCRYGSAWRSACSLQAS